MKRVLILTLLMAMLPAMPAIAATKTYQVTGPVLEVNDSMIAV